MKKALITLAWLSIVGSVADAVIILFSLYLAVFDANVSLGISVDALIKNHISFLYWIKQLAYYVLPHKFVVWLFALPALLYFPFRLMTSALIGWWLMRIARNMP